MTASQRRPSGGTSKRVAGRGTLVRLLGVATVFALAVASLAWAVGSPLAVLREFRLAVGTEFDDLLVRSAGLAAWVGLAWVGVAVMLETATTLPGSCGRGCAIVASAISPRLVRRVAQALIGISVLAGPLTAAPAMAATGAATSSTSPAASSDLRLPDLDRPAPNVTGGLDLRSAPPAPAPSSAPVDLDLDRPGNRIQSQPPPPRATTAPAPTVLAGGTEREKAEPVYVVRRGDALWDVAARHLGPNASATEIAHEWPRWHAANRAVIGSDPDLIRPGEVLTPPKL